jgi:3-dehydroquinate synthase
VIEIPFELKDRRYAASIGHGLLDSLPELLPGIAGRPCLVVSNRRVWSLHGARLERALRLVGPTSRVLIPDGERFKSARSLARVHDALAAAGISRDGAVIAFGGGVVTDLAGFAAASWMRGIDWVALPTTLLAMVDAALGGKVGINHAAGKNLIGAFHQPRAVVSDPALLATLPARQVRNGAYEAVKCGVLADRALLDEVREMPADVSAWDRVALENMVASASRIKADIVVRDERESGARRLLNLGHTVGHALETATRYRRFLHGEAVGWGLIAAAEIARYRGMLPDSGFERIAGAVDHLGRRPPISDVAPEAIFEALGHDKKVRRGRLHFVLPAARGRVVVRDDVGRGEIRRALRVLAARERDAA